MIYIQQIIACLASSMLLLHAGEPRADVVVYGGMPGGIAASVMASRAGASVLLTEPTRILTRRISAARLERS